MSGDFILKIQGIDGESQIKGHENQIEVSSWNWGAVQQASFHHGSGGGAAKAQVHDMHFTKLYDKSSPALALACLTGRHIDKAELFVRKAGGDNAQVPYLKFELINVFVSSYQVNGHSGNGIAQESFSLNFAEIKKDYQIQDAKGKGKPSGNLHYNIAAQHKK